MFFSTVSVRQSCNEDVRFKAMSEHGSVAMLRSESYLTFSVVAVDCERKV